MTTAQKYTAALVGIGLSVFALPDFEMMVKVYVISVVAFITTIVNLLFNLVRIRDYVANMLTAQVIQQIFSDKDVRKLVQIAERQATRRERKRKNSR